MNEQGVAAYIGCFQSPVGIAASQAASKYNTPFLIDVGASDLIVNRGLKNVFRLKPGFGVCVDQGVAALGDLNKAAGGPAKSAVIVHESGEFGTGTAKLLAGKLPSIVIQPKELIAHDNPTRNFDNIALRIRSKAPDIVDVELRQRIHAAGAHAVQRRSMSPASSSWAALSSSRRCPTSAIHDGRQSWYNPRPQANALRSGRGGALFTFEVYHLHQHDVAGRR
jgi:branched-chain amino acid transport system substrate-binding protein